MMLESSPRVRHFFFAFGSFLRRSGQYLPLPYSAVIATEISASSARSLASAGAGRPLPSLRSLSWRARSGASLTPSKRVEALMVRERNSMLCSSAAAERASVSSVMKFCATQAARDEAVHSRRRSASTEVRKARASSSVGAAGAAIALGGAGSTFGGSGGGSASHAATARQATAKGMVWRGRERMAERFTRRAREREPSA